MIRLYYGKDDFTLKKTVEAQSDERAEKIVYGEGEIEALSSQILSQSFFNEKRIFIVKKILSKIDPKGEAKLLKALKEADDNTEVIFIEEELPKKSKIKDYITKAGTLKEFPLSSNYDVISFIKNRAKEEGVEIAPLAAERLATFVGPDFWQLEEEIKKLSLYKMNEMETEPIQTSDVDLLVKANFEANIFGLLDAIAAKNKKKAADLLNSFLDSGENEIYILTMISRQFRNIAMAKFEELPEAVFAKKAAIHPYVAKKTKEQAKNFGKEEIVEIYQKLCWADLKLKSGHDPAQILLYLIA